MFVFAISGKIEVEHVISKKLQLKRKAEVCELGFYSGKHLAVFDLGCLIIIIIKKIDIPSYIQYFKNDLMRQLDSQVNDFMDSLIEESASLEPAPLPAVFSPLMSDKEKNKLRCCLIADFKRTTDLTLHLKTTIIFFLLTVMLLCSF